MKAIVPQKKVIQGEEIKPVFNREGKRRLRKNKQYKIAYDMLRDAAMKEMMTEMEEKANGYNTDETNR